MLNITQNVAVTLVAAVTANGAAVVVTGTPMASVLSLQGQVLVPTQAAAVMDDGSVAVALSAADTAAVPVGDAMLVLSGSFGVKRLALRCQSASVITRSMLFVKDLAVDSLRRDRLMLAAAGAMPTVAVSDDYLWDKLRSAEASIARELRVPLVPTAFFPDTPSDAEIAALGGMPWAIDPGYDYNPSEFSFSDKWGFLKLRNKPLQSVSRVRFAYPGGPTAHYDLPLDWIRSDKKFGQIQFVPSSTAFAAPLNAFVMQAIGNGRTIPLAIQISYVAGLANVAQDWPDIIDAVMKTASLKVIEDAFLPQSGSISADGLSQSMSNDMDKHHDMIDRLLHGGKGSNGGLMAAIHGVRLGVC